MPLPQRWNQKHKKVPIGFDYISTILEVLENELRDKMKDQNSNQRKIESLWPIHQINYQKTRYIYDMYYTYKKISYEVYQYCITQKYIDPALIAKWKKPGYEKLCSTYVINPSNYKFNTVSICRVPYKDRSNDQKYAKDPTTGCLGCASGSGGPKNIFGNKYGQNLAAIQIAREKYQEIRQKQKEQKQFEQQEQERLKRQQKQLQKEQNGLDEGDTETDDDEDEDDDDDENDYGPTPTAGIWAGSQKLQHQSEQMMINPEGNNGTSNNVNPGSNNDDDGEDETDDDDNNNDDRPHKKLRVDADDDDTTDDE